MELTLATPAMLFPAISLLLLAYTNRFLSLASLVRGMENHSESQQVLAQIDNLRRRIDLIQRMQEAGVISFLTCVLCMIFIYLGLNQISYWIFGGSLLSLLYSLWLSVREIRISVQALDIHLNRLCSPTKDRKKWFK